jgi:hypothetical protein
VRLLTRAVLAVLARNVLAAAIERHGLPLAWVSLRLEGLAGAVLVLIALRDLLG